MASFTNCKINLGIVSQLLDLTYDFKNFKVPRNMTFLGTIV